MFKYHIKNYNEPGLYWNNTIGWVDYLEREIFTGYDVETLKLPLNGVWELEE